MYLATQILKTTIVPVLVLLPSPGPGIQRDMARDIGQLQRAECEYRGIAASFDEVTRAYILQVYKGGQLLRWQARPSPYNPDTETLITAVFTTTGQKVPAPNPEIARFRADSQAAGITWRYSILAATRITPHGDYARDAMTVFRQTIDDFVDRMVYAPQAVVLRATISPAGEILARLDAGTVLLIEDERENWLHVRNPSSKETGWLPRSQVRYIDN